MMSARQSEVQLPMLRNALALVLLAQAGVSAGPVWAETLNPADFPFIVYCEYKGTSSAYYLSQVGPDGVAIYLTPDNKVARITVEGTPNVVGGERSGSCAGKTLNDLRAAGQAFDVPR